MFPLGNRASLGDTVARKLVKGNLKVVGHIDASLKWNIAARC